MAASAAALKVANVMAFFPRTTGSYAVVSRWLGPVLPEEGTPRGGSSGGIGIPYTSNRKPQGIQRGGKTNEGVGGKEFRCSGNVTDLDRVSFLLSRQHLG